MGTKALPPNDKPASAGQGGAPLGADLDRKLLDLLRSLNMAIAQVAEAREQRYSRPEGKLSPDIADHALLHLKDAAGIAVELKRMLR